MKRDRSQSMVIRGNRILLVEHQLFGRDFFNLPGQGNFGKTFDGGI